MMDGAEIDESVWDVVPYLMRDGRRACRCEARLFGWMGSRVPAGVLGVSDCVGARKQAAYGSPAAEGGILSICLGDLYAIHSSSCCGCVDGCFLV